ncbi:lipid A deacylase LpxR family protein [Aureibacter tunicatorum]|uniref:Lipid A deacylase LpxR family protein n=1 Tax=Aureibacter tunicatorum TaxID=866807 RepID=A0AAE3XGE6_9BACT|nr:lipid A deacylase LpxR family protein [Aureibacter tunicatorum]MDR6237126.1 hypothetical protein [Aureibacter tunicatorum]BDD06118.1 hypothetical protein AUTU_36010 [Aureibacter tunicatorum]
MKRYLYLLFCLFLPICKAKAQSKDKNSQNTEHISTTDSTRIFSFGVANDVPYQTDKYFSNGIYMSYQSQGLGKWPLRKLMLPVPKDQDFISYYSIDLTHNLYTPRYTMEPETHMGDHPYSSYLLFGYEKVNYSNSRKIKFGSKLSVGVIGPMAGGEFVQSGFHDVAPGAEVPVGWENQIENDFLINYGAFIEKGIWNTKHFDLNAQANLNVGTLYTNAGAGITSRFGLFEGYFTGNPLRAGKYRGKKNWQVYAFFNNNLKAVGYNAVLQGGVFNSNGSNVSIIANEDLNRLVYEQTFGIAAQYKGIRAEIGQAFNTREFKSAGSHMWGYLKVSIAF